MPQVIATTVYRLDELPEGAKDRARAWYREGGFDHDWYDGVYEDFQRIAEILGIRLKTRVSRLVGGRTREDPCIWFSGFWSQGDGAAWEGSYSYRKSAAADLRAYAPKDQTLHRIVETLQAAQHLDVPLIMGSVLFGAVLIGLANLLVDIIYTWLDPRIQLE